MNIKNGVKPIVKDHRNYSYHATFGAVSPVTFPENWNADAGLTMPDQNLEGQPYGCTNYTQDELCTDIDLVVYDHNQMEAITHANADGGGSIIDALKAAITLRNKSAYFQIENFAGDWFDSIRATILHNARTTVSVGTYWYGDFERIGSDGIVLDASNLNTSVSRHNWKICGWKTINGVPYLIGKTWQGRGYGNSGYAYFPRNIINELLSQYGTGAFTIATADSNTIQTIKVSVIEKMLSILRIMVSQMITKPIITGDIPNMRLYNVAYSYLGQHITLNDTVPGEVGCSEAVSFVLKNSGIEVPQGGIAGTGQLYSWLKSNPLFEEINTYEVGAIILCPTGMSTIGSAHGHVGICGKLSIMSNDSATGTFHAYWTYPEWKKHYEDDLKFPTKFFRLK